mmetsp:Transcript_110358/g.225650  ORF Transcript_110358/g.225650 Transcript_110358/m.225650 type:complete len:109 (-) Transcript_110358:52-378(-)
MASKNSYLWDRFPRADYPRTDPLQNESFLLCVGHRSKLFLRLYEVARNSPILGSLNGLHHSFPGSCLVALLFLVCWFDDKILKVLRFGEQTVTIALITLRCLAHFLHV